MYHKKRVILAILDGWGHTNDANVSAIKQANTPFTDALYHQYPNAELVTFGEAVGLPAGQMGNSEVGHLNIGAGRIVYQELLRINNAIQDRSLHQNDTLLAAIDYAKAENKAFHLMGLVSDGGVHSHINHLTALCDILKDNGLQKVYIHAFMDGRDTDPKGGIDYIKTIEKYLATSDSPAQIATVIGRYYAMDRDKRWERIQKAYDLLVNGKGTPSTNLTESIAASYEAGVTDEFILPIVAVDEAGKAIAQIQEGDVVLSFNFRTDRCRQISQVLTQADMPEYDMKKLNLHYCTMTKYDDSFQNVEVLFHKNDLKNTLGAILAQAGKKQIRIAETEKYPHVTFFFSGGREAAMEGEERLLIPSPKVATYDLQPEMSASELTAAILPKIKEKAADFICLNFANTDMVGHTGVFEAAIKAAETVDQCLSEIVKAALAEDYALIIIADHGNADKMINPDGSPNTAHTTNMVPCFLVGNDLEGIPLQSGKLADIAPTILTIMGLEIPNEMDGSVLIHSPK